MTSQLDTAETRTRIRIRKLLAQALAAIAAAVVIGFWLSQFLAELLLEDTELVSNNRVELMASLAILAVGWVLFRVREELQALYGIIEIFLAVVVAFHTTTKLRAALSSKGSVPLDEDVPSMLAILGLVGCAYVVVRGMDNIAKGRKVFIGIETDAENASSGSE